MSVRRRAAQHLAAAAVSAGISLAVMPLVTLRLGPTAFGAVALVVAVVSLGNALATLGTSFAVYRFLPEAGASEREAVVSSLLIVAAGVVALWALAVVALALVWPGFFRGIPPAGIALGLVAMVLSPAWSIASDVLMVDGRVRLFAWSLVAQSAAGAGATLVALFPGGLGVTSLFVGHATSAFVLFLVAANVLRPALARPEAPRFRAIVELAWHTLPAQLSESGVTVAERVLLSRTVGLAQLGLYAHSQRYREVAGLTVKSAARAVWPASLAEARDSERFERTERAWTPLHVLITLGGVAMAALGDHAIALLTNGRFTAAHPFATTWFVYLLLTNSVRPQVATLYARGEGRVVARAGTIANVVAIVALCILVPTFGAAGALAAGLVHAVVSRAAWFVAARRYRATPFQDWWVIAGSGAIALTLAVKVTVVSSLTGDAALWLATTAVVLVAGGRQLKDVARTNRPD